MKKFTLMAILTLIATFTFAQLQPRGQQMIRPLSDGLVQKNIANGLSKMVQSPTARLSKAPRRPTTEEPPYPIIQEQPAGREATYAPTAGKYFYVATDNKIYQTDITQKMTVIFGEDNKVYLKDPLSMGVIYWLEGTVSEDGKTITIPVGQNTYYNASADVAYQACMMEANANKTDYVKSSATSIVYALTPNGLKMKDTDEDHIVGVAFKTTNPVNIQFDDAWSGYGAYGAEYELTTTPKKEVVVVPEGVTSETWTLNGETYTYDENYYPTGRTNRNEARVQVAIDGNDFYVQGLCKYLQNSWVKGTRDGNTVTFPTMQYFGNLYNKYDLFFEGTTDDDNQTEKDVVFTYDENAKELKTTDAIWITFDDSYTDVYFNTVIKQSESPINEVNTNVVRTQPAGELKGYARTGSAFTYNFLYGVYQFSQNGMAAEVVYDADGTTVWFKDPISGFTNNTWVKATREGNTITLPLNQCLEYYDTEEYGYGLASLKQVIREENGEENIFYEKNPDVTNVTFTIDDAAGTITLNGTGNDAENYPENLFGLVYVDNDPDYNDQWAGYGDWATVYSPVNYQPVSAPADLQTEEWNFTYNNDGGPRDGKIVKVGFQGNDLYVQGISELVPDAWVKGTINGDKVTFEQNQYFGIGNGYLIFLKGAKGELTYDDYYEEYYMDYSLLDGPLTLTYDAAAKTLSGEDTFVENAGDGDLYYNATFDNPFLSVYVEKSAKPANPVITGYYDYFDYIGYNALYISIPTIDVDGNVIKTDKLAFQLYTDIEGEVDNYTFYADEYQLTEDRVIINYDEEILDISGNYIDISAADGAVYIYQTGFDKIGIQSINYTAGKEERSDIVWYVINDYNAIKTVSEAETVSTRYTDLSGRAVAQPAHGLYIKTMRLADGTQRSVKVVRK